METAESETAGAEAGPLPHAPGPSEEVPETEGTEGGETSHEWYYQEPTTGQPAGPWTVAQLRARWQRDEINGLTPVWHVGLESWIPIAEMSELKDALRQTVADVADVEERPAKRRRTLDEVPLIHTYTNEQGQLYVYDTVDEDWKASDIYEALLEEPSGDVPERPDREAPTVTVDGEGMTPEEQDAAMQELFEEANRGGPLGAGPTMDPRRQVASDLAVERAHGEVAAQVAKAKAAKAAKAVEGQDADKEAKRQKRREYRERKKLKQQAGLFIKAKENPNVYVSGLPPDTTAQELDPLFKRAGVLKLDMETCASKIRVYTGADGRCKGDALVTFANAASVELAVKFLHEYEIRPGCRICVQQADFEETEKKDAKLSKDELKELAAARKPEDQRAKYLAAKNTLKEAVSWSGEMDDGTGRRIVLLRHMFSPEQAEKGGPSFYEELIEEVKEECEKIGQVMRVTPIERHVQGIVCIKFKLSSEAEECIRVMDGRLFDGRYLEASFYDGKTDLKAFGVVQDPPRKPSEEAPPSAPPPRASAEAPAAENKTTAEATAGEVDEEPDAPEPIVLEEPNPTDPTAPEIQQAYDAMFEDQSSDDEDLVVRTE